MQTGPAGALKTEKAPAGQNSDTSQHNYIIKPGLAATRYRDARKISLQSPKPLFLDPSEIFLDPLELFLTPLSNGRVFLHNLHAGSRAGLKKGCCGDHR